MRLKMKLSGLLTFLVAAFAMQSCTDTRRADALLSRADSLMETDADSARRLLVKDSAMICSSGRAARMWYALSRAEADDKRYVTHTSDSAISAAAEYYSDNGTPLQRIRAYYLLGRVNCDLRLYGRALSAFKKALSVKSDEDSVINRYKARAATWAGHVYEEKGLHNDALRYNKMSYANAVRSGESDLEVYSLRDIGRSYSYLKKNKIAIPYYLRAAGTAESLHDGYLYSMVMEELASIYMEEGLLEKAREALSAPFYKTNNQDIASHYFIWAMYFERTGQLDSALIYNKLGMAYGDMPSNRDVSRDLAQICIRAGKRDEAMKYYDMYFLYADSLKSYEPKETSDLLSHVEQMLDVERENTALANAKTRLIAILSVVSLIVMAVVFAAVRYYANTKRRIREQQKRVKAHFNRQHESDVQSIARNEERIACLEKELSMSNEKLTELGKSLMRNEAELLSKRNEQIRFEQKRRAMLETDFTETDIYKLYHNPATTPSKGDYHNLIQTLDKTYSDFTFRLKEFYPDITENEMWICCMIKTGLSSKEICNISPYSFSSVSMAKSRLYSKIFNEKGSAKKFDSFVKDF